MKKRGEKVLSRLRVALLRPLAPREFGRCLSCGREIVGSENARCPKCGGSLESWAWWRTSLVQRAAVWVLGLPLLATVVLLTLPQSARGFATPTNPPSPRVMMIAGFGPPFLAFMVQSSVIVSFIVWTRRVGGGMPEALARRLFRHLTLAMMAGLLASSAIWMCLVWHWWTVGLDAKPL